MSKPRVVFVGKGGFTPPESLSAKFVILARYLDATIISVDSGRSQLPPTSVRMVAFPGSPRPIASIAFYLLAPILAVARAARHASVVVCQSPYEAFGALLTRRALPRRLRPRVVVEVHGDWRTASRLYGSWSRRLMAPAADRLAVWALRRTDRVRAVSVEMEVLVRKAGYQGEVDRFVTYSDFRAFLDPPPSPLPAKPVVLFIGVFEPYKGVDVLIEAFEEMANRVPAAELWMVGEGRLRGAVQARTEALGVAARVRFLGIRPRIELPGIIDRASCLVLPSRSEGLPRVIIEAMARARPVVASRVGGIPELVEDGVTGLFVPSEDPGALAEALAEVLKDRGTAERMGRAGRTRVEARDPAREFEEGVRRLAAWAACVREVER